MTFPPKQLKYVRNLPQTAKATPFFIEPKTNNRYNKQTADNKMLYNCLYLWSGKLLYIVYKMKTIEAFLKTYLHSSF